IVGVSASGEFEIRDARAPVEAAAGFQILGGVPESAIVNRIHAQAAVIAPAAQASGLGAHAISDVHFGPHSAEGIAGGATREPNAGTQRARRNAIADSDVAGMVHGCAAHPAEVGVGSKRALLENGGRAARAADFIPAD